MADPTRAAFRKPFAEQVAAWRIRLGDLRPTYRWDDLAGPEHDRAFVVAGATKADLLADLAGAVGKAIEDGTTLEQFRADFEGIVEKHGWHGWTGEETEKGRAWRTKVIYKTNIRTSYAAGRLAQLRAGGFPIWVYLHGNSLEPREDHLSWHRVALPVEHPFWAIHYPPNGWGCSCRVRGARNRAGIRRVGGDPDKALPDTWQEIDAKTGLPVGVSKGWDHAPGNSAVDLIQAMTPRLSQLPPQPSIGLIQSWLANPIFQSWYQEPRGNFPLARISEEAAARIGAKSTVVVMSPQTAAKQLRHHPDLLWQDYSVVQDVIDQATDVIEQDGNNLVFVRQAEGGGHTLVVKATKSGEGLFATSFRRLTGSRGQIARELERLRNKRR